MMDRPISAALALALCLLLNGCSDLASFGAFVGYLNGDLTGGGGALRADKPCPDCRYSYDMVNGLRENKTQ